MAEVFLIGALAGFIALGAVKADHKIQRGWHKIVKVVAIGPHRHHKP